KGIWGDTPDKPKVLHQGLDHPVPRLEHLAGQVKADARATILASPNEHPFDARVAALWRRGWCDRVLAVAAENLDDLPLVLVIVIAVRVAGTRSSAARLGRLDGVLDVERGEPELLSHHRFDLGVAQRRTVLPRRCDGDKGLKVQVVVVGKQHFERASLVHAQNTSVLSCTPVAAATAGS